MEKMIIIGAGGFGREMLEWIKDINNVKPTWEISGFIDDNLNALDGFECDYMVIGLIKEWQPAENEVFALALGNPKSKEAVVNSMKARGAVFASIIHPTAKLSEFSKHGEGLIMFPYAKISVNSAVGDFVTVLSSGIGHDVYVGDYSTISGMCSIMPQVRIGKRVFLAANAAVTYNVQIGDDAYIGLGSIVLKDVNTGQHTFASPARAMPV